MHVIICIYRYIYAILIFGELLILISFPRLLLADLPLLTTLVNHPYSGGAFVPYNTGLTQHLLRHQIQRKWAWHAMSQGSTPARQTWFYRTRGAPSSVCQLNRSVIAQSRFSPINSPVLNIDGFLTRFFFCVCAQKCCWLPIWASYEIIASKNVYGYGVENPNQLLLNSI